MFCYENTRNESSPLTWPRAESELVVILNETDPNWFCSFRLDSFYSPTFFCMFSRWRRRWALSILCCLVLASYQESPLFLLLTWSFLLWFLFFFFFLCFSFWWISYKEGRRGVRPLGLELLIFRVWMDRDRGFCLGGYRFLVCGHWWHL